ncbi:MAG TPA: hypothetical protein VGH80_10960 [Xanthomonadaceae bacterium]|jgi:urease gamma subunit
MSIHSKARRDARKKKQGKQRRGAAARTIEPHATLHDGGGALLAGAGRRGNEWVIVLDGKVVAGTESPAMTMAMLRHMASVRESEGLPVRLAYSTQLKSLASLEATRQGKTLAELLSALETERLERHGHDVASGDALDAASTVDMALPMGNEPSTDELSPGGRPDG